MTEYDNTDKGVLFKNDRKQTENHPDYKGEINIGGTVHWLSAWIKSGKNGKFLSLAIGGEKDGVTSKGGKTNPAGRSRTDDNLDDSSEIPF